MRRGFVFFLEAIPRFFELSSPSAVNAIESICSEFCRIRNGGRQPIQIRERDTAATKDDKSDLVERYQYLRGLCEEIISENDRDWPDAFASNIRDVVKSMRIICETADDVINNPNSERFACLR